MPEKRPTVEEILNARELEYGNALANFQKIGKIWAALIGVDQIEPHQVALMMDALKTVRVFNNPQHFDSWLDKLGYVQHAIEITKHDS